VVDSFNAHDDRVDRLIAPLYDAVGAGERMKAALASLSFTLGASTLVVFSLASPSSREPEHYLVDGVSRRAMVEYQEHFYRYDPWVKAAHDAGVQPGQWCCGHELVPPADLYASYFGRDFLAWQGLHDVLSGFLDMSTGQVPMVMVISFHKRIDQGFFTAADKALFQSLLPHCQRALRLHRRLAPQLALGRTLHEMFRDAESPMFYVGEDGRILECNSAAKQFLACPEAATKLKVEPEPGTRPARLSVRLADGWLSLVDAMQPLAALDHPSLHLSLGEGADENLGLAVRRVHGADAFEAPHTRLFALCTLRRDELRDKLKQVSLRFSLTPRETETLRLLSEGHSPSQIAEATGIRITTVRSHLSNVLAKTGTGRQAQLLALVAKTESRPPGPGALAGGSRRLSC
jgi:DNA-binding CsgD family transcriptional regulator